MPDLHAAHDGFPTSNYGLLSQTKFKGPPFVVGAVKLRAVFQVARVINLDQLALLWPLALRLVDKLVDEAIIALLERRVEEVVLKRTLVLRPGPVTKDDVERWKADFCTSLVQLFDWDRACICWWTRCTPQSGRAAERILRSSGAER